MEAVAATAKGDNGKSAESTTDPKKKEEETQEEAGENGQYCPRKRS